MQREFDFDAPPHSGPETSREAAVAMTSAASLRAKVSDFIRARGWHGATDEEIQDALQMDGNTQRPRRWELAKAGLITTHGMRVGRSGRRALVWIHVSLTKGALPCEPSPAHA